MRYRIAERYGMDPYAIESVWSDDELRMAAHQERLRMAEEQRETDGLIKALIGSTLG